MTSAAEYLDPNAAEWMDPSEVTQAAITEHYQHQIADCLCFRETLASAVLDMARQRVARHGEDAVFTELRRIAVSLRRP